MSHPATWHVHYDDVAVEIGHVCDAIRDVGRQLTCPDGDADAEGNCAHVQMKRCTCEPTRPCEVDHAVGVAPPFPTEAYEADVRQSGH